jgi:hypothetical protein
VCSPPYTSRSTGHHSKTRLGSVPSERWCIRSGYGSNSVHRRVGLRVALWRRSRADSVQRSPPSESSSRSYRRLASSSRETQDTDSADTPCRAVSIRTREMVHTWYTTGRTHTDAYTHGCIYICIDIYTHTQVVHKHEKVHQYRVYTHTYTRMHTRTYTWEYGAFTQHTYAHHESKKNVSTPGKREVQPRGGVTSNPPLGTRTPLDNTKGYGPLRFIHDSIGRPQTG